MSHRSLNPKPHYAYSLSIYIYVTMMLIYVVLIQLLIKKMLIIFQGASQATKKTAQTGLANEYLILALP